MTFKDWDQKLRYDLREEWKQYSRLPILSKLVMLWLNEFNQFAYSNLQMMHLVDFINTTHSVWKSTKKSNFHP